VLSAKRPITAGESKHSMRLFIAVNLNDDMKDALIDVQDTMRTYGVHGKDTPPENMHLTLAFIGEYDDPELVKEVVESIEVRPFKIRLSGIGAFGDLWWVGLENSAPLMAVSRRLRRALAEAGIPFDKKKFSPHITMIRRASGRLSEEAKEEMNAHLKPNAAAGGQAAAHECGCAASMTVDHISLMRSDRGKYGMIYTEL